MSQGIAGQIGGPSASDLELSDGNFSRIAELVRTNTGIQLPEHKRTLVKSRLSKRLSALSLTNFDDYLKLLESGRSQEETTEFFNAITTNLTSFFREPHHFEHMSSELSHGATCEPLRIWSAGCSSGEETYSIAMTLLTNDATKRHSNTRILATDLDTNVLDRARSGLYASDRIEGIPDNIRKEFVTNRTEKEFAIAQACKDLIVFNQLNLLNDWPITIEFDFIFCRNVMIYFEKQIQDRLVGRLIDQLKMNGVLYIGHSETALGRHPRLSCEGHTIYRKIA